MKKTETKEADKAFTDMAFIMADFGLYVSTHNKVNAEKWQKRIHKRYMKLITHALAEREKEIVEKAFDWIWDGWNLDVSNKDRAKKHFLSHLKENL